MSSSLETARVVTAFAVGLCSAALAACLIVLPGLYAEINALRREVTTDATEFRQLADDSWHQMMILQAAAAAQPGKNLAQSVF